MGLQESRNLQDLKDPSWIEKRLPHYGGRVYVDPYKQTVHSLLSLKDQENQEFGPFLHKRAQLRHPHLISVLSYNYLGTGFSSDRGPLCS